VTILITNKQVLAHRGVWTDLAGQPILPNNSIDAIIRAKDLGFGLETDLRDQFGNLVISHDVPIVEAPVVNMDLLRGFMGPLALNVKSDGLIKLINDQVSMDEALEIFFFDMSVPEERQYAKASLPFASRVSEYESGVAEGASWIWLDAFESDWYLASESKVADLLAMKKKIAVVSPELHGRDMLDCWKLLARLMREHTNLHLCTDFPELFINIHGA